MITRCQRTQHVTCTNIVGRYDVLTGPACIESAQTPMLTCAMLWHCRYTGEALEDEEYFPFGDEDEDEEGEVSIGC